jgi:heme/copper-type cytochrome/quinol oxidase subunit 2
LLVSYKKTLVEALKIGEDFGERISSYAMVMVVVVVVVMMMVIIRKMRKKSKLEGEELLLCVIA